MLQQQVEATYLSVCIGQATSCSNKSRRHITPCVQVGRQVAATRCGDISLRMHRSGDQLQQHVAATHRSDKSLRVYWRIFVKIFVSATEFCRRNKSQKLSDLIFCAMLLRENSIAETKIFTHRKKSIYTRSDLSLRNVAATCCCNLDYEKSLTFPERAKASAWKSPHARKARRGRERGLSPAAPYPPRLAFLSWGDFHGSSSFARSTIPEGKWATTCRLLQFVA